MRFYSHFVSLSIFVSFFAAAQINPSRVTIYRDSLGMAHIHGTTDAETAYGLGWAHCEDDFQHVQENLLAARGRLGEVLGKDGVLFDYALQFLSIDTLVAAHYDRDLSPEFKKVVDAYIQAINDFARTHPSEVLLPKALPFTSIDAVRGYTLNLSLLAGVGLALKSIKQNQINDYFACNDVGSNSLAIAPSRTDDGKTWLLSNSHQPLEGRFAWWETHLISDEGTNCIGGLFPGGISIFVGTSPTLGWTHTTNYNTWGDIYLLKTRGQKYWYDNQWRSFTTRKAKLKVKLGGINFTFYKKIRSTEYGPVYKTKHGSYAIRFPAYMQKINAAEQWWHMNRARNWQQFEAALKMEAIPQFNVMYADGEGNIFYQSMGMYPRRDPSLNWRAPITANTSAYKWTELLRYDEKPFVLNPQCGYLYNCNQTPLHATGEDCNWKGNFIGLQLFEYNRGERFGRLLGEKLGKFTWADFKRIKFDKAYDDNPNSSYLSHFKNVYAIDEKKYPDIAPLIIRLKNWNKRCEIDNKDATIGMLLHYKLTKESKGPFAFLTIKNKLVSETEAVDALRWAKKLLLKTHGTLELPLGEIQRHMRGNVSMPASGGYEVPRAADPKLYDKKGGIFRITNGDGYIQMAKFSKTGVELQTVLPYGTSSRPRSKHYTDQMTAFQKEQTHSNTFELKEVIRQAEYIYHPGEFDYVKASEVTNTN